MSIHNFTNKIKGKIGIDNITIFYLLIIIGVALGSFGLGRISTPKEGKEANNRVNIKQEGLILADNQDKEVESGYTSIPQVEVKEKKYVASKNGKMYYTPDCSGAGRIKAENEIWFSSKDDAEKSGYTLSSICK
ncbi:MAG TPA: hypothetical protein VK153_00465 [Candidatus Paceibacterota bacterium]|nr:hypothetical protein [Candidatus Paceibacterota bacterium]